MAPRYGETAQPLVRSRRAARLREFLEDTGRAAGMAEEGLSGPDLGLSSQQAENKKILVVSTDPGFAAPLIHQALGVAERLGTEVVGLSIGAPENGEADAHAAKARELFVMKAEQSATDFARQAREAGLAFRHVVRFGRPTDIIEKECAQLRRVEFVLTLKQQRGGGGFRVSMPLFEVTG